VLAFVADGIAWVLGQLLRAFSWLVGLAHVHLPEQELEQVPLRVKTVSAQASPSVGASRAGRSVATVVVTGLAIAAAVGVVAFALRRLGQAPAHAEAVVEERETLRSMTSATGAALGGLRRRLGSAVRRRRRARTAAEAIRLRYERLEAGLTRAGRPRTPGMTVRAYLDASVEGGGSGVAGELASLYELARYSDRAVGDAQATRFRELARSCRPVDASRSDLTSDSLRRTLTDT